MTVCPIALARPVATTAAAGSAAIVVALRRLALTGPASVSPTVMARSVAVTAAAATAASRATGTWFASTGIV